MLTHQEFDNKNVYIRRLCLAGIVLLTALLQNTEGLLPSVLGFRAMPLIPAVICIAMYERELPGMFFGVFAGLLWDSAARTGTNLNTILLTILAFVCGCLITHLMRNNILKDEELAKEEPAKPAKKPAARKKAAPKKKAE